MCLHSPFEPNFTFQSLDHKSTAKAINLRINSFQTSSTQKPSLTVPPLPAPQGEPRTRESDCPPRVHSRGDASRSAAARGGRGGRASIDSIISIGACVAASGMRLSRARRAENRRGRGARTPYTIYQPAPACESPARPIAQANCAGPRSREAVPAAVRPRRIGRAA